MQRRLPVFTGIALALAATASPVAAQTFAITNAHLLTPGPVGEVQNGTVLVRAGRIAAAGANVAVPSGVRTIDAKGATVTPGLIAGNTAPGLLDRKSGVSGKRVSVRQGLGGRRRFKKKQSQSRKYPNSTDTKKNH